MSLKPKLSHPLSRISQLGFWLLLIVMPFRYRVLVAERVVDNIYGDYTDILVFSSDALLLFTLTVWLLYKGISRQPFKRPPRLMTMPLVALVVMSMVSIPTSLDPQLSIYHVLRLLLLLGFVIYIVDTVHTLHDVAFPLALQIGIQSFVGISQFLRQRDIGWQFAGEYALQPEWSGVSIVFVEGQRWLRAYGLTDHPNILGGCLAFGLLVLSGYILSEEGYLTTIFIRPIFLLGNIALFTSLSRSAWLAYAAGILFLSGLFLLQEQRDARRRLFQLIVPTLIIVIPFMFSFSSLIYTRLPVENSADRVGVEQQSIGERALLNEISLRVLSQHPVLGTGIGTSPQAIRQAAPDLRTSYQPAHIALLTAAMEIGILGALAYAALMAVPFIVFVRSPILQRSLPMITASIALLAIIVVSLFDYYPWLLVPGRLWQFLVLGLWGTYYLQAMKETYDR